MPLYHETMTLGDYTPHGEATKKLDKSWNRAQKMMTVHGALVFLGILASGSFLYMYYTQDSFEKYYEPVHQVNAIVLIAVAVVAIILGIIAVKLAMNVNKRLDHRITSINVSKIGWRTTLLTAALLLIEAIAIFIPILL